MLLFVYLFGIAGRGRVFSMQYNASGRKTAPIFLRGRSKIRSNSAQEQNDAQKSESVLCKEKNISVK